MQSAAFDPVKSAECIWIGWDVLHDYTQAIKNASPDPNPGGGGGNLGNSLWGVPPDSSNPDPISDQKCHFPVFRPGL